MKISFYILYLSLLPVLTLNAQDHTTGSGPHGNGVYDESGLMKSWNEGCPEIVWTFDSLGLGFSSPVIANNHIYLSGMEGETGYVYALTNEGKLVWKAAYGAEFTVKCPGTRGSPVVAGDLLYLLSGLGKVICMEANTGSVKWTVDIVKEYGGRIITSGYNETMAIDGDKLFVTPGGSKHTIIALNRKDGSLIWSSTVEGDKCAYCTPLIIKLKDRTLLVTHLELHVAGLDAGTGELLWTYPDPWDLNVHANTPIFYNGDLFCFCGYGKGGVKLRLSPDGNSVTKEWVAGTMDNRIGAAVLVDGYIYGSGEKNRYWMCIDWKTGEEKFQAKGLANGTVITAERMLYGYTDNGILFLAKADPAGLNVISKTKVTLGRDLHLAHPVIDKGRLLLRHGNVLIAYKIAEK